MPLPPASLLLLGAALGVFVPESCCGCPSHFLRYHYLEVSEPSQEQPQFSIWSYLDEQPIARFDSLTRKMEPLVPWMKEVEKEGFLAPERVFSADLKKLSKLDHPTEGLHTWQAILGCELREDGSKGRFFHYGYGGMDFIAFENETLKWMAPQPLAEKVKQKLEENPDWSPRNKDYLEKNCIDRLQEYLSDRKKTPEDTKPPKGKMNYTVVNDSQVLICQAFGFYPKKIQATWTRDGEVCQNETLHRNMTPNSDGTYNVRISIKIDPKERKRFQCHLEHEGLQEPLVLALKEETATERLILVRIVIAVLILNTGIVFLIGWRNLVGFEATILGAGIVFLIDKWKEVLGYQKAKPLLEDSPSEILCLPPTSGREEDERLLNSSLQSEITLDANLTVAEVYDRASDGGWSSQRAVEDSGSTLRRREGKQQPLRKSKSWAGELEALDKAGATESEESRLWGPKAENVAWRFKSRSAF